MDLIWHKTEKQKNLNPLVLGESKALQTTFYCLWLLEVENLLLAQPIIHIILPQTKT